MLMSFACWCLVFMERPLVAGITDCAFILFVGLYYGFLALIFSSVLKFKDAKKKIMQRISLTTVPCRVIWSKNQQFCLYFKPVSTYQSPCAYVWTEPTYFKMSCKIKWSTGHFSLEVYSHSPFNFCISAPPFFFFLFFCSAHMLLASGSVTSQLVYKNAS